MQQADQRETSARLRAGASVHQGPDANLVALRQREPKLVVHPTEPGPGAPRRTGRGFVESYGIGRVCGASGCTTRLSQYNRASSCALHDDAGRLVSRRD